MLKMRLILSSTLFFTVTVLSGLWPGVTQAQQETTGKNFIFINYVGQEMILDLDDVTYIVPGSDTAPEGGPLTLTLPEGKHKFAANLPGGPAGYAGEFTITPGGFVAKAARLDKTSPIIDNQGILLEAPREFVLVFDFDPFAAPVEEVPVVDTWQPSATMPAMGSLVLVNYIGDELTLDLNGTLYKVSPPANNIPGRLQIDVPPGNHRYTASVPAGSLNSDITVVAGQVIALNITADPLPPREYKVGEEFEFIQPATMKLFEEDLTEQATPPAPSATADDTTPSITPDDSAPLTLPATGGEVDPVMAPLPAISDGLVIKNYAGDTLIFTIDNQIHTIAPNTEQTLTLPPGQYTYTASTPGVATGGTVDLGTGYSIRLSIAINVAHDFLNVYYATKTPQNLSRP